MRIWLVEAGEPLPVDKLKHRPWRIGLLAESLWHRGHDLTWWASTFDHTHKIHRHEVDTTIQVKQNYKLKMLHGSGYKKNVSIRRLWDHYAVAKKFTKLADGEANPDVILCCLPTLDLCSAVTKYGAARNVPTILDIRDMWPEIMIDFFPKTVRPLLKLCAWPMYRSLEKACSLASGISGMTENFVQKGLLHARRKKGPFDRDFPFGYPEPDLTGEKIQSAEKFWDHYGVDTQKSKFIVSFIGSLSSRMELRTLIEAARLLQDISENILFVICGKGEDEDNCKKLAQGCKHIIFPSWIGQAEIWTLMNRSSAGVIPYPSTPDFCASIPNKAIEYMAGGLPIISSVKGVLQKLLAENRCGLTYANADPEDLVAALNELKNNPRKTEEMGLNSRRLYEKKFRAEKVYTKMSEYVEFIATTHKKSFENHGFKE